jgi:hypothetical protein
MHVTIRHFDESDAEVVHTSTVSQPRGAAGANTNPYPGRTVTLGCTTSKLWWTMATTRAHIIYILFIALFSLFFHSKL